jgi:hypothetical protein
MKNKKLVPLAALATTPTPAPQPTKSFWAIYRAKKVSTTWVWDGPMLGNVLAVTAKQARAAARTQLRKSYTGGTYILIDESVGQCELVTL